MSQSADEAMLRAGAYACMDPETDDLGIFLDASPEEIPPADQEALHLILKALRIFHAKQEDCSVRRPAADTPDTRVFAFWPPTERRDPDFSPRLCAPENTHDGRNSHAAR